MEALVGVHDGLQLQGRQLAPLDTVLHQTYAIVNARQSWQHGHGIMGMPCRSVWQALHQVLHAVHACIVRTCKTITRQFTVHAESTRRVVQD